MGPGRPRGGLNGRAPSLKLFICDPANVGCIGRRSIPDTNPTNNQNIMNSTTEILTNVITTKKVLLFTSDFEAGKILLKFLKKGDHVVIDTVDELELLIEAIARTTPHLVVAHLPADSILGAGILELVGRYFPSLPVCLFSGNLQKNPHQWQKVLAETLCRDIPPEVIRPYGFESRYVLHDESLQAFWKGKLKRPKNEDGWEKICSDQEARFVLQLQTARRNHTAARHYYHCLLAQQEGLDQELSYRLSHGSYKALSWSRELVCKWLALLAHYVPDVELQHLPLAGTPGPAIDYVHHDAPVECMYAASLMLLSKTNPSVAETIKELVVIRFNQEDDAVLLSTSLKLYGMAKFLEQVGRAQIELMEAWMDRNIIRQPDDARMPRSTERNSGIYRDFYGFSFIVHTPEPFLSILKGFHEGTTYVEERRYMPSFVEFRRLCRKAQGDKVKAIEGAE